MTNFDVTISYKAVISVSIKAETEEEAKEKAVEYFKSKERKKWYNSSQTSLQDDSIKAVGVLDMDDSWHLL